MKRNLLFFFIVLLPMVANAYDAEIDGIYYNLGGDEAEVTYEEDFNATPSYTGAIIIPEFVTYNDKTYSVTSIGSFAFYDCSDLTSITIPNSVTSIGSWAFAGTLWYNNQPDGLVYAGKVAYKYKGEMPSGTSIAIKEGTLGIAEEAFSHCSGLTSVTIPNSMTNIGSYAFYGCSSLISITIPESLTSIDAGAFDDTAWYNNQPDGLLYIGKVAYKYKGTMPEGTRITIKEGTLVIAVGAFSCCTGLTSIFIPNSVTSIGRYAFLDCTSLTSITIPNSVTSISERTFSGCSSLTSITIPNSVTSIGWCAFCGCSSLTSITIPNSVTSIGYAAFQDCTSLTSITIPNSVTSIGWCAFCGCSSLTSITIPNSVTSIGYDAFQDCTSLTSITIPESVIDIGGGAFSGCNGLTSVTINCPTVDLWFHGMSSIKKVTLGETVTSIYLYAFAGCTGLSSVVIGSGVTRIDRDSFRGCSSLKDVYCLSEKPVKAFLAFSYCPIENATLHVPATALDAYKETLPWKSFGTIVALAENSADLNGDFKVDIADAVSVLNIMAENKYSEAADVNGDNKVDIADFVTILNIMAEQ